MKKSVFEMMYICTEKGEQLQDTKYWGKLPSATDRPPSATAKTKYCHSLFPIGNIFVSRKRKKIISTHNYIIMQHTNLKVRLEQDIEIERKRKKVKQRKRE